jgi:protein-S-isoprenylcysteine O-methyltransferase Ste14
MFIRRAFPIALAAVLLAATPVLVMGQPRAPDPAKADPKAGLPVAPHATDAPWRWWLVGGGLVLMTIGGTVAVVVLRRAMRSG